MANTSNPTNNDFVVKVSLDVDSGSITALQNKINGIPITPIPIKLDTTDAQNKINALRNQIQALNNIQVNIGGNGNTGGGSGGRQRNGTLNNITRAYRELISLQSRITSKFEKLNNLDTSKSQREIVSLTKQINNLSQRYTALYNNFSHGFNNIQLDNLNRGFSISAEKIELINSKVNDIKTNLANDIILRLDNGTIDNDVSKLVSKLSLIETQNNKVTISFKQFEDALNSLKLAQNTGDINAIIDANERYENALKDVKNQIDINLRAEKKYYKDNGFDLDKTNLNDSVISWVKDNSAAIKKFGDDFNDLIDKINNCDNKAELDNLKKEFISLQKQVKLTGKNTQTFFDKFKSQVSKLGVYYSASAIFMQGMNAMREMYDNVLLIDTAMTELIKVTNEADEAYSRFLDNAGKKAQKIGTTIDGFISSTADFARLGYSFEESQELAEVANIYAVVGDEIDGVDQATESLISTLSAFKDEVTAMDIIDKFNEIGNNFAISSGGIGEALKRSASSLKSANNTLDESIALITAANTVVQDPEVVGTAFKTVSMRIRGAKTELEQAGLETEGMVESTAKMREEIMALTGVDIMIDENRFKSTYDILDEIAVKWEELTDIQRASVTELIAGKRQGNIISSLMQNFEDARKVVEMSANSEGSALEEHAKWSESLEAHINKLTVAWQDLSQTVLNSDLLKTGISILTELIKFVDNLIEHLGGINSTIIAFGATKGISSILEAMKDLSAVEKFGGKIFSLSNILKILGSAFPNAKDGVDNFSKALKFGASNATTARAALSSLWMVISKHPIALTVSVIAILATKFISLAKSAEKAAQAMDESFAEFEEAKKKTEELNNELKTTKARIEELENKKGLSFVEEEELKKLRETVRLLEIQEGIEKRNEERKAIEAAEAAEEAYNKNFKYEISEEATESKRNWAENGYIQSLSVDESDVSSLIVYREEMEKLRDACDVTTEKGAENWKYYSEEIKKTDGIIDNQLAKLVDYQLKFNSVPEGLLTDNQKQISDIIDNQIDYIEKTKDEGKWRQDKFDSIFDDKTLAEEKQKYVEYAKAHKETGLIIGEVWGKLSPKLETAIRQAGFTVQDFVDNVNSEAGILKVNTEVEIVPTKYSFSDLMKDEGFVGKVDTHIEKVDKLKDALDKLKDGSFDIDGEDFVELVKEFPELADNADNLEEALKQSIEDINLGTFEELISYLEYMDSDVDYTSLQNFISALTDAEVEMHNVLDFTDFLDNLNNVVDSFDNLVGAMSKLRDGTALTKGEIVDLISEYPKLLTEANLFTDGSISGQQKMLDNILQVYEAEYNALIDTKIAELKASNEVLNAALENEKAKAQKVIEISALEVEGKVLNESELVRKLQEFNDLEGQNYVEYSNGVLSVNKEMLDDMLVQEGEKKDLAETNVWKPQAVDIAESYASGASDALQSLNTFGTRLGTWAKNTINNTFKPLKKAFSAIFNNEEEITEDAGSSTVDTNIKAGLSIEEDGKATIDGQSINDWSAKQQDILEQRIKDIQDSLKKNNIAIENLENLKGLDLVSLYGGDGSGSGGSNSSSKSSQTFNWIETAIERVQRALSNLDRTANSVYKSWGTRNDALSKQIKKTRKEIDLQNKAAEYYKQKANSIGLDDKWKQKIEKGLIEGNLNEVISNIDTSTDSGKALADKISQYQEWYSKILECEDAVLELKESESDLYKQSFDNVMSQYESVLSIIEHEKSMIDIYISQSEAKGHIVSTKYYESLMKHEENNIAKLQEERDVLIASLEDGMANGGIEKYSEQWFDMVNSIDEITLAIEEGKLALLEYGNAIQEIEWSIFDMLQKQISQVTDEANFLIDLVSNDKLYDDKGQLTDSGMATMGMHGMNYNTYMHQADLYAEKILEIDKELAEDPYNQTLIDKKQEYIEAQRDSILAAEDEKQAIVDMVQEGIELELDALQELIDAKKEELDAEKSLYEYQKKTAKQVKDIASLRKQLASLENDNSEETRVKVQQLKLELQDAEEELADSQYERFVDDTQKMLDELTDQYSEILNSRLDNVDALISDVITDINENASSINETITEASNSVGYTLSDTMVQTWSASTSEITSVLTTYGSSIWGSINSGTTTLSSALNTINTNIGNMVIALNGYVSSMNTSHAGSYDDIPISNPSKPTVKEEKESVKDTNNNQNKNDGNKKDNDNKKEESNKSNSISKGDTVSVSSSAKIYDYAGDTSGERQYYRNDPTYVVLNEKNGYVQVRHSSLGSGVTGWFKKSDIKGYATGKRNFLSDEIAWTQENGREFIIRPSDGAILTPLAKGDSVLNNMASNNIWDMANNPTDFIKDNLKLDIADTPINNGGLTNMTQNLENVVFQFPAVKNYDEMLSAMKSDRNFERLIMSMTIDQVAGKSSLAKGKSIR